ncbi:16S rRNA (guanine(966)-N(2))-methyltransferase RsmD [Sphingobacterium faecium]|jgi:16S rRNA (guanine966-N2)-methyltransferase|uniref:16S rRNA (guanine(966)-N(2))-methyltransferase RsmD n=1 Tax=Sphingobacterium faecium TaxID=34087 RepID=UPI0004E5F461|nr:16S rRNA (guanine(966)-N(2))-methyltransferase RsmD [Sphingobacterium faecium]UXD70989.1 16S rRNA (guanine(966)-N(2))-methyltransferase RsmD [Sphingobacterium faecium]CDS91857.1 RsmD family RNA methyltransferase [Sphingobacterium sp. PM2-P1-29]
MRIIGGQYGGIRLNPPTNLPVRPTTDIAKEALFNILQNRLDFDELTCLDLFAGTGNISFELASRYAHAVESIDLHFKCVQYIAETAKKMNISSIKAKKADVFKYIQTAKHKFDFIFADPPYDIPKLPQLAHLILENELLNKGGLLIIEHPSTREMDSHPNFVEKRKYGYSSFSFYTC